jgi:hypothetical protein
LIDGLDWIGLEGRRFSMAAWEVLGFRILEVEEEEEEEEEEVLGFL